MRERESEWEKKRKRKSGSGANIVLLIYLSKCKQNEDNFIIIQYKNIYKCMH